MNHKEQLALAEQRIAELEVILRTQQKQIERLHDARNAEHILRERAERRLRKAERRHQISRD